MAHLPQPLQRIARTLLSSWRSVDRQLAERRVRSASIDIRPLIEPDIERVRQALPDSGLTEADLTDHQAHRTTIIVAWLDRTPVGIGWTHWDGPRDAVLMTRIGRVPEIHRLHVNRRYRCFGLGTRIIKSFELLAYEKGLVWIGLGVHTRNHRATTLYRRLGFLETGERYLDEFVIPRADGKMHQVSEPAIYMIRDISTRSRAASALRGRSIARPGTRPAIVE